MVELQWCTLADPLPTQLRAFLSAYTRCAWRQTHTPIVVSKSVRWEFIHPSNHTSIHSNISPDVHSTIHWSIRPHIIHHRGSQWCWTQSHFVSVKAGLQSGQEFASLPVAYTGSETVGEDTGNRTCNFLTMCCQALCCPIDSYMNRGLVEKLFMLVLQVLRPSCCFWSLPLSSSKLLRKNTSAQQLALCLLFTLVTLVEKKKGAPTQLNIVQLNKYFFSCFVTQNGPKMCQCLRPPNSKTGSTGCCSSCTLWEFIIFWSPIQCLYYFRTF